MKSIPLIEVTRRLGAPKNWNHETDGICHTLEICDRDGWMISAWRPTPAEIKLINEGQPIFLYIQGYNHPVVGFTVGK
jgi:hypothetical protein